MSMDILEVIGAICFLLCFMYMAKLIENIFTKMKNKMMTVHCIIQLY